MNKEKIKELADKKDSLYEEWRKTEKEYYSVLNEDFEDYKGKYIVIDDSIYIYVDSFFTETRDRYIDIVFNGKGFEYNICGDADDCYFKCDMYMQKTVRLEKYSSISYSGQLKNIVKIIDESEFNKQFLESFSEFQEMWQY